MKAAKGRLQAFSAIFAERSYCHKNVVDTMHPDASRKAYGNLAGWQSSRNWRNGKETYAGMVEVSRALMKVCSPRLCIFLKHPHFLRAFVDLTASVCVGSPRSNYKADGRHKLLM